MKQMDPSKFEFEVNWLPFQLNSRAPTVGVNKLKMYHEKFGKERCDQMIPYMKQVGDSCGINFSYGGKTGNTMRAHRLVEWAGLQGKEDAMMEKLFEFYFEQEQDITDVKVLAGAAKAIGLDEGKAATFLAGDEHTDTVATKAMKAQRSTGGISGVPYFVVTNTSAGKKSSLSGAQESATFVKIFSTL